MMNPAEFANIAALEESFWWFRGMRSILFRLLDPLHTRYKPQRVLEGGCGTGHLSRELEARYGWRMYPIDLAAEGLAYGRSLGVQRMTQANLAALPFADNAFDAVLSMDVLVHFPRGQETTPFRELVRTLKPGGLFVIRVSALDILRSRHSQFAEERQRFNKPRLVQLARESGLVIHRCTYLNSLLLPVTLVKFRVIEPLMSGPPESGVTPMPPWLDRLLHIPLALERMWLGAGGGFALGQSLLLIGEKRKS